MVVLVVTLFFFFQAEDGIRDLVRSRGLGDVYKRQPLGCGQQRGGEPKPDVHGERTHRRGGLARFGHELSLIHI